MVGDLMADGNKRIDLGAPLLSVRRGGAVAAPSAALPFYKPDLKSGPLRHPGAVPFVWEHRPGQPKPCTSKVGSSVRTRRPRPPSASTRSSSSQEKEAEEEIGTSSQENVHAEAAVAVKPQESDLKTIADTTTRNSSIEESTAKAEKELVEVEITKVVERKEMVVAAQKEEEEERFSDALDTLSRTESFVMNCSVSGLSGVPDHPAADPDARGFMMDRFLPAAQAVAVDSPLYAFRKASTAAGTAASTREPTRPRPANAWTSNGDSRPRRLPVQLPYQHLPPNDVSCSYPKHEEHEEGEEEDEDDDEDYDVHSTRHFASKGCGLLPRLCMKSSFLLLNPVSVMKPRGGGQGQGLPPLGRGRRVPSPLVWSSPNGHLGQDSTEQSWEAVYKHKLRQRYQGQGEDGRSKLTSESNQLTYWSDSQTADGSSPFRCSTGRGASPYHTDVAVSLSNKGNGSVGMGDKDEKTSRRSDGSGSLGRDGDSGSLVGSDLGNLKGSGSMSSGLDRTVREDCMDLRKHIDMKASRLGMVPDTKAVLNTSKHGSELGRGRQIVEAAHIVKGQDNDSSTQKISEVREPALPMPSERSGPGKLDDGKNFGHDASQDYPLRLEDNIIVKKEVTPLQSILPLPLPKSPSESWLSRTLPSVSSKKPPMLSFLGIQMQSRKQAPWALMDPKDNDFKPSRARQIRFAEVLEKPNSLNSEI